MTDPATAAFEWAARAGPPNVVFVLALLTRPSTWSKKAMQIVEDRFGSSSTE